MIRPAEDLAYWDLIAALSTAPDRNWFPATFIDQRRPDLTGEVLIDRRDTFLAAARVVAGGVVVPRAMVLAR